MRTQRLTPMLLAATLTVAGAAAAAGYGLTAPKRYEATAKLLVTPVPASDPTFAGFGLLGDPGTAAALVRTPEVATAVRTQLGLHRSVSSLLHDVRAHVESGSNVVDVTARNTASVSAAQVANAFVDALIAQRTATFQSELSAALARTPSDALRRLQGRPDPTLHRASTALAPTSPSSPKLAVLVLGGAGAGLVAAALLSLCLLGLTPRRSPRDPAAALAERERTLAERVAAVTKRELVLARAAAVQPASPAPEPVPAAPAANGGFNLSLLERLVAEQGPAHADRAEEWESYLFYLREYAEPDGALPHSFDGLVEETFRPLLPLTVSQRR